MLLFHLEDLLDQHAAGRIIVTQPSYDLRVRFNRDAFRDEILPYHVGQAFAGFVFRVTAGGESLRLEGRLSTDLSDPLGYPVSVLLLIVCMLQEFFFN